MADGRDSVNGPSSITDALRHSIEMKTKIVDILGDGTIIKKPHMQKHFFDLIADAAGDNGVFESGIFRDGTSTINFNFIKNDLIKVH